MPNNPLFFRLLVALSADGRWMQFSQTTPRLFSAFMRALELDWMFDDPHWSSVPDFDDIQQRTEYFERMLAAVRAKTTAEWQEVFDREPDVWAEIFRHGSELLDAPPDAARPIGRDRRRYRARRGACNRARWST